MLHVILMTDRTFAFFFIDFDCDTTAIRHIGVVQPEAIDVDIKHL